MHLIANIDATLNGLGQGGAVYTDHPGAVDVWEDGSYTIYAGGDQGAVDVYATGGVDPRLTRVSTAAAALQAIEDDHGDDVVLDGTTIRVYPAA